MSLTILIPQNWKSPLFGFGQRTDLGTIIGLKYYASDTYLGNEYGTGWHYVMLADKNDEDEEHRIEDQVKLLSPQELKTTLEAEIENYQHQIQSLKQQLDTIPDVSTESTTKTEAVSAIQHQSTISPPELHRLVDAAKFIIKEIAKHPDYLTLEYQPDLTLGDAQSALSYLELELEPNHNSNATSNTSAQK
ncbi:hypothetical protein LC593_32450 [Nostoc sp. CHAB 5844]|nr:hypothetical protein [Nostoc sp. CHAB 5844]